MSHRYEVLKSLVNLSKPINEIKNLLRELDWDFEGEAFVLEKKHLSHILKLFIDDKLSASDIELWANLIECREDLEFEKYYFDKISEIIFSLANPTLYGEFSKDSAINFLSSLQEKTK